MRSPLAALAVPILVALCLAPRAARAGGCPADKEPPGRYQVRARAAQAAGDYRRAADELWGAWCSAGDPRVLVRICTVHVQGGDCKQGQEMLRFARKRARALGPRGDEELRQCGLQLRSLCAAAAAAAAAGGPATSAVVGRRQVPAAAVAEAPEPPEAEGAAEAAVPSSPTAEAAPAPVAEAEAAPAASPGRPSQSDLVKELRGVQTGTLRLVVSGPSDGARYFVDDLEYAERDLLGTPGLRLPAGRRRVIVQKEGYAPFSRDVELPATGTAVVYVPLRRTPRAR